MAERMKGLENEVAAIGTLKTEVDHMKSTIQKLETTVSHLLIKTDELENRSRRNNLVIYSIKEDGKETEAELTDKIIKDIFSERLGITINGIERCHRIGRKSDRNRPAIIKLQDYREKTAILKACPKLKGSEFSVSEDYSKRIRDVRKKLWESASQEKTNGAKVKLVFDKLSIDGDMFGWDSAKNQRYKFPKSQK